MPKEPELTLQQYRMRPANLVRRGQRLAVTLFNQEASDLDLTRPQFEAMIAISHFPGLDQITLARALGIDRSTMTLVLDGLMDRTLLHRTVHPQDRRRRVLDLTALGLRALEAARLRARLAQDRLMSPFSKGERVEFVDAMSRVVLGARSSAPPLELPTGIPAAQSAEFAGLMGRPAFLLRRCAQIGFAFFGEATQGLDLTPIQYGVMFLLKVLPTDEATAARLLAVERSTIDRLLQRLKARGYVERVDDDSRAPLHLSAQGEALFYKVRDMAIEADRLMFGPLSAVERERLVNMLDKLLVAQGA